MDDTQTEKTSSGWGGWIIAAVGAALTAVLGVVGYQAGWFDQLLGKGKWNRSEDKNNFKHLGLAIHNYNDVHGSLPTNVHSKDGKPLLSWRIHLLPHMGYEELYKQFKLDEPWDSEHNKKLISKMPKEFAVAGSKPEDGMTYIQAFEGKADDTVRPLLVKGATKGIDFNAITDGTSNTTMLIEANQSVEWTKPQDLEFTPKGPMPKVGGRSGQGTTLVGLADGSVRTFDGLSDNDLRAYATINGGERNPGNEYYAPLRPSDTPPPKPELGKER